MDLILQYASLFLTGILAGTASGLFGVGGGFLMTPVQFWVYSSGGIDSTLATRLAFGTSLAVMIPTMISGAFAHHSRGAVNWKAAMPMGCAAIIGGLIGGTLAAHLPGLVLRTFFAILAVTTIPSARLGVKIAHSYSGRNLQIVFAGLLILIGGAMLIGG